MEEERLDFISVFSVREAVDKSSLSVLLMNYCKIVAYFSNCWAEKYSLTVTVVLDVTSYGISDLLGFQIECVLKQA